MSQHSEFGGYSISDTNSGSSAASLVSVYSQQQTCPTANSNVHLMNHKIQNFSKNGAMSIHEVPDQNDFELQLLNANRNSSELVPTSK